MTTPTIEKTRQDAPPGFFEAEAAGLRWLADAGGALVADVVDVGAGRIVLQRIEHERPTRRAARAFGAALAVTHRAGAPAFGVGPDDERLPQYIGRRRMAAAREDRWGVFYARDRVLPFVQTAVDAGTVDPTEARVIREACDRIAAGDFDDDEPPARIHGDLWNGNVLWSPAGVVLIDPAAHGGHRETDLAMLALFGCPYLDDVTAAYDEAWPLLDGWRSRVSLHQLHPLAVHAAGHGRSYGVALAEAASVVLTG